MRRLGLIGGMSFESTAIYYRKINEAVNALRGDLNAAELILHSVNFQDIIEMQKSGNWDAAGQRLARAAEGLKAAGAECILICAVTMHLVADAVEAATALPFIHIVDEVAGRLKAAGCSRPLLIATKYTMEGAFYPQRMKPYGIEVRVPHNEERADIQRIIFDELSFGAVKDESREILLRIIERAKAEGADCVIFGCTEICLILDANGLPLPGFDSAAIHIEAAVRFAIAEPLVQP